METNLKFNSAICTSREQSERLLALGLKKETADMVYKPHSHYPDEVINYCEPTPMVGPLRKYIIADDIDFRYYIPAWSLHRLKCLLPEKTPYGDGYLTVEIINENVYIVLVIENVEQRVLKYTKGNLYDNLISCVNFFVKESLFNKEYLEE